MTRCRLCLLCLGLLWPLLTHAGVRLEYRADLARQQLDEQSMFVVPEPYRELATDTQQYELLLKYTRDKLRMVIAADARGSDQETTLPVQTRVDEMVLDFAAGGYEWSVGKKIVSWGVGYGFRPLDIIQQESRLQWQALSAEGRPVLSMERFGDDDADSWLWFRDSRVTPLSTQYRNALAYQHYALQNSGDLYVVAMLDEYGSYKLGGGFSQVVNNNIEWHGSLLYLSDYEKFIRTEGAALIASSDPFQNGRYSQGTQLLLGASRHYASGFSVMLEGWYDPAAYSINEWGALLTLSAQQLALLGGATPEAAIYGNLNWNSRAFQATSLMQQNLLLRVSYTGERWEPALFLLHAPEDGGYIANLSMVAEVGDSTRLYLAWQQFGGQAGSVYAQMPMQQMLSLGFSLAGLW